MKSLKQMIKSLILLPSWMLPTGILQKFIIGIVAHRARSLEPEEGLRFLFHIDARLYTLQSGLAIAYDNGVHTKHRHTKYHNFFIERISAKERVLDVGCGIGVVAYDVAVQTGAEVVGIDLNPQSIETARTHYSHPNVYYIVGNALADLPREHFDVVIISNVLEHIEKRPEFLRSAQELVKSARWLIRVPLLMRDWRVPLKQELGVEWRLDPTHFTEYTLEQFSEEIGAAGMQIVEQIVQWGEIWAEVHTTEAFSSRGKVGSG